MSVSFQLNQRQVSFSKERLAVRVSELVSVTENVSDNSGAKLLKPRCESPAVTQTQMRSIGLETHIDIETLLEIISCGMELKEACWGGPSFRDQRTTAAACSRSEK